MYYNLVAGKVVDSILYEIFFAALSSEMLKLSKMYEPWWNCIEFVVVYGEVVVGILK